VTVEREPSTESEDAVKGTDTASSTDADDGEESGSDAPDASEGPDEGAGTDESVDVIKGIGATYADRLGEAGVETVADLAASDPETLSEESGISEGRLSNWIEKANHR
jgi:predicted flap endonuclease-1-like 5' DNA nuclease